MLLFKIRFLRIKSKKKDYVVPDTRLREILHHFGYSHMSDKNLFLKSNLSWFYINLKVRHLDHDLYIEAMERIEVLLDKP